MKNLSNEIILCGSNNFNCYGMLRSLAKANIYPTLILNKCEVPFVAKSKYVRNKVYYYENPDELPALLKAHVSDYACKPIVICCDDLLQSAVDREYDELKSRYILSSAKNVQGEITRLMDKSVQMEIARNNGLTVPKSWILKKGERIPRDMVYPCIAKPEISINGSKSEIEICRDESRLAEALSRRDYLVQEFVEKEYEAIVFGTSVGEGEYYMPLVTKKYRHYPDCNGLSSYGKLETFEAHPGLDKSALHNFLKALGYTGLFSIEMAVKENKYYLLEINLRNDGKQYFSTVAGANLPELYIKSLLGRKFREPKLKLPVYYMLETGDMFHVLRGEISVWRWIRDLIRTDTFFVLNLRDIKPFIYKLKGKM